MSTLNREVFERVESVILPLMGSRELDHVCFEYIPVAVGPLQIRFAIPPWVSNRETLAIGDVINFHIFLSVDDVTRNRGIVMRSEWDHALGSPVYVAEFQDAPEHRGSVYLTIKSSKEQSLSAAQLSLECPNDCSPKDLLCLILKDVVYLKRGVGVYLEHLFPYFSRISEYPRKEFRALKEMVLDQISVSISEKCVRLQAIYEKSKSDPRSMQEILESINFEEFRSLVESEFPLEVIRKTFGTASDAPRLRSPLPYLLAIQDLEKRLYTNYNILTTIKAQRMQNSGRSHELQAVG